MFGFIVFLITGILAVVKFVFSLIVLIYTCKIAMGCSRDKNRK